MISDEDVALIVAVSAMDNWNVTVLHRQSLHLAFNEEQAKISGLNVALLNHVFAVLAAITGNVYETCRDTAHIGVGCNIEHLAIIFGKGFEKTVGTAILLSVVMGIFFSCCFDLTPSETPVLTAVAILLIVLTEIYKILTQKTGIWFAVCMR